ncbi:hypothetical protein [Deinococcus hopiensis]|uniref:hypothetical protein n=1 Tax=Deinococcus hopiensis TaxID=309885 RepID=UPI000A05788D|nr:hypothetical protein [Deinococcus hopiensis]
MSSDKLSVTSQRLGSGLGVQTLENAPALGLNTQPLSTVTFVTTQGGVSTRHIQATNSSGQTLHNLVFAPVTTSDIDGNAENNAQGPTAAGTPFRAVQYFGGSDVPAQAGKLVLSQGKVLDSATQQVCVDPAADPFSVDLDASRLSVTPPAGLTATVLHSGWPVAPTVAPGGSTNVTFAVDLPGIDPQNKRPQPYSFNLVFMGGVDGNASSLGTSADAGRLSGQLPDWKFSKVLLTRWGRDEQVGFSTEVLLGETAADGRRKP